MPDRHEHLAVRSAYRERIVRGRSATRAVAILTADYDLALFELEGVPDTAFVRQRALIARADDELPSDAVEAITGYIAEVEAGRIPCQSPPTLPITALAYSTRLHRMLSRDFTLTHTECVAFALHGREIRRVRTRNRKRDPRDRRSRLSFDPLNRRGHTRGQNVFKNVSAFETPWICQPT